ncbi:MAG: DUF177 domain-containing protein [Bacteroidia bacterium]|nr:DUF177 domain-containing protein [Bacteroidia bacterium]
MKAFSVNIIGLSLKAHQFEYEFGRDFFEKYGKDFVSDGHFSATVALDKHETFIEAEFKIKGEAKLICDRSLEPFDFPIDIARRIMFKYGEEEQELSDEIIIISRDRVSLEIGQYLYEYILLSIPIKKVHPKYRDEEEENDESEGKMIYTSEPKSSGEEKEVDPRWEVLKKLKK